MSIQRSVRGGTIENRMGQRGSRYVSHQGFARVQAADAREASRLLMSWLFGLKRSLHKYLLRFHGSMSVCLHTLAIVKAKEWRPRRDSNTQPPA